MYRYPGNHVDSGIVTVPRKLKTRPGAPQTHLAYITPDEEKILQQYKPGTPHRGPEEIPNYDTWAWDGSSGSSVTGGSTAGGGGAWSGDVGGNQSDPDQGNQNNQDNQGNDQTSIPSVDTLINNDVTNTVTPLTEKEKIWQLATQAYESNPGYAKSWKGQQIEKRFGKGTPEYENAMIQEFGLPQIISTGTYQGNYGDKWSSAIKTTGTGDFIYSGQGKHLMDQYGDATAGSYEDQVANYYATTGGGQNDQGGNQRYGGWPNFGNWGGSSGPGNYGRYANWYKKNKYNYDSPFARILAERRANPVQPDNISKYTQMMANANRGGIMGLRR